MDGPYGTNWENSEIHQNPTRNIVGSVVEEKTARGASTGRQTGGPTKV